MKKFLYLIVTLLEVAILAGTYVVNYFTVKKLGMVRWVNAKGLSWEKNYPIPVIKGAVIIILLLFVFFIICLFLKKRNSLKKINYCMVAATVVLTIFSIGYLIFSSFTSMRAYYLISMMFVAATVLQLLKTVAGILVCRNEK